MEEENYSYYLRTYLKGTSLIDERFLNNPELLINILVDVVRTLHSLDTKNIQIRSTDNIGNSFIHGDLCLPNILVDEDNKLVGFIDLGNAGLGDPWYDLSWLLWSLEYNLKTNKYNNLLIDIRKDDLVKIRGQVTRRLDKYQIVVSNIEKI